MLIDLEKARSVDPVVHDVCVLGAGAAGITLALELIRRGKRVLLLEAGGAGFDPRAQALYAGESEGLPFTGLYDGRFRVLGGTTTQWGGQILELDEQVFAPRPWAPGGAWPFAKPELAPWYRRAVALEGLERALDAADAIWRALEVERPDYGPELASAFSRWCPVTDFWKLHGGELERSTLAQVYIRANACELLLAEDGRTVRAVRCRTLGGRVADFQARAYVICMGGLESCRFLMQPAKEGAAPPWSRSGLIGRHFQEHLVADVASVDLHRPELAASWFDYVSVGGLRYHPKIKLAAEAQARLGTLDVCGTVTLTSGGRDDLAVAFETFRLLKTRRYASLGPGRLAHFLGHLPTLAWHKLPFSRANQGAGGADRVLKLTVHCEQAPLSEGRVTLSAERDALGLYRAKVAWRASALERHSIRAFVDTARQAFEAGGVGRITPVPGVLEDDDRLDASLRESCHHMGGLRMAESPREGVVDPNLRLHGAANAYVCSSAVFPSAGFANPTHTLIALAARLAAHLAAGPELQAAASPPVERAGA